jgi:3-oxoacyl-[acyl-carrier-protein] synthase II
MKRRVVITGLGPITPIGTGKKKYWNALLSGKSGGRSIVFEGCEMDQYTSRIACPVQDFSITDFLPRNKDLKYLGRTSQFALAGTRLALEDAGFKLKASEGRHGESGYRIRNIAPEKVGVILGVGAENMDLMEKYHGKFIEHHGPRRISPFALPHIIISSVTANVSTKFGIKGKTLTVSSACASSTHAVIEAFMQIQMDKESVLVTGGADACITPYIFGGFDVLKAMSARNDEPEKASRPFDRDRDGFVLGEGAGIVVVEELSHALRRGASIYCEITGCGATSDAHHIAAPETSGESLARSIADAMKMAHARAEKIDYVNAHGTSTVLNDLAETLAIKKAFGRSAYQIPISSTKSMTGHLMGAAGGIEIIATALTLENGKIHPTINFESPGEGCDLDYVPDEPRDKAVHKAVKVSSAFGGYNAALVLEKYHA